MNVLPRARAEQILAEHAAGKSIRAIAQEYGHSAGTIRDYVRGRRIPGEVMPRPGEFAPLAGYCRQRLADDPHLRTPALFAELTRLGMKAGLTTFYRGLEHHGIRVHPCPDCHPASITGHAALPAARHPLPPPLPMPVAPVTGEALASFLGRLAAANRTSASALLEVLPPWFRVRARWHDDRWQHDQVTPWADAAAASLAMLSGSATAAIKNALPAFGQDCGQPARALTACRPCAAARRISQPVPVHLPAHHQVCLTHGIWLSAPGAPQLSVSNCPEILAAERQARRLLRRCTIEQLVYARLQAPAAPAGRGWKRRMPALIRSNPRQATESGSQALLQAAAYPEAIAAAAVACTGRPKPAQSKPY